MPKIPSTSNTRVKRPIRIVPVGLKMVGKKMRFSPVGGITKGLVGVDVRVLVALGPAVGGAPIVEIDVRVLVALGPAVGGAPIVEVEVLVSVIVIVRVGVLVNMIGMKVWVGVTGGWEKGLSAEYSGPAGLPP